MEARSWFRMLAVPEGAQLEALLEFAAARRAHYPTFLLVQREPPATPERETKAAADLRASAKELLAALGEQRITETITDRWPGEVSRSKAKVSFYRLDHHAARALARIGSLAAFAPPLPEDLCILASDKTPWLVSSTGKARFHLHLTQDEQREIAKALPWLALAPEPNPPQQA